ncbi:hypothetical protein N0V93_004670 [Gnomoniopsis smithogilvyi]|uniref:Heterokaryon incompatibility domain-containing protein n=1 Tax=Gnomoniopsis smithogilvyi TaxID=1191159 RepID=A0A9W9CXE4_9PEZI|nr:hypothetical protein N0V93_004670 [Gnomoniopsis smithogilvyi]
MLVSKAQFEQNHNLPPINSDAAEIRIIELQPHGGSKDSRLVGNYQVKSLNDLDISYEALSYAWGTDNRHREAIVMDGREVSVTGPLANALRRLRLKTDIRYLWADAICINQEDTDEKTKQVGMMGRVYRTCSQCNIWLGVLGSVSSEDAKGAIEMITCVAKQEPTPSWFKNTERHKGVQHAIRDLMTRPWWSRIWTVQEAFLPRRAMIYYGPYQLPWTTLDQASETLMDGHVSFKVEAFMPSNDITIPMRALRFCETDNYTHLLHRWRFRWASDPRDKVFGLAGIRGKPCDYTLDAKRLYRDVMVGLIQDARDLHPMIGMRNEEHVVEGLPSWVVDWTRPKDKSKWRENYWEYWELYSVSRWRWHYGADKGVPQIGETLDFHDLWTLKLNGRFVDKVAVVERPEDVSGKLDATSLETLVLFGSQRWRKLVSRYEELFPPSESIETDGMLLKLWQLVAGRFLPERPEVGEDRVKWVEQIITKEPLFVTEKGLVGFGQWGTNPGHEVWIVGGSAWPFVLHKFFDPTTSDDLDFRFIGECIVPTIMSGQAPGKNVQFRLH